MQRKGWAGDDKWWWKWKEGENTKQGENKPSDVCGSNNMVWDISRIISALIKLAVLCCFCVTWKMNLKCHFSAQRVLFRQWRQLWVGRWGWGRPSARLFHHFFNTFKFLFRGLFTPRQHLPLHHNHPLLLFTGAKKNTSDFFWGFNKSGTNSVSLSGSGWHYL